MKCRRTDLPTKGILSTLILLDVSPSFVIHFSLIQVLYLASGRNTFPVILYLTDSLLELLFFQTLNIKDSGLNLWLSSLLYPHSLHDLLLSCMAFTSISTPAIPRFPSLAQVSTIFILIDPNASPSCPLDISLSLSNDQD